jgi:hypothetical protein
LARSRDSKREKTAAVRTGAGTPSSIAAMAVHLPSPESETRPENSDNSGDSVKAAAVKSSNQEETTLPRRQSSAISGMLKSY